MKPYPLELLNHFTVPCTSIALLNRDFEISLRSAGGITLTLLKIRIARSVPESRAQSIGQSSFLLEKSKLIIHIKSFYYDLLAEPVLRGEKPEVIENPRNGLGVSKLSASNHLLQLLAVMATGNYFLIFLGLRLAGR